MIFNPWAGRKIFPKVPTYCFLSNAHWAGLLCEASTRAAQVICANSGYAINKGLFPVRIVPAPFEIVVGSIVSTLPPCVKNGGDLLATSTAYLAEQTRTRTGTKLACPRFWNFAAMNSAFLHRQRRASVADHIAASVTGSWDLVGDCKHLPGKEPITNDRRLLGQTRCFRLLNTLVGGVWWGP